MKQILKYSVLFLFALAFSIFAITSTTKAATDNCPEVTVATYGATYNTNCNYQYNICTQNGTAADVCANQAQLYVLDGYKLDQCGAGYLQANNLPACTQDMSPVVSEMTQIQQDYLTPATNGSGSGSGSGGSASGSGTGGAAGSAAGSNGNISYVPLEPIPGANQTGTVSFGLLLTGLLKTLISLGGLVAVLALIFGGVAYMVSSVGVTLSAAKERMKSAIYGLLLLIACWLILSTINPQLLFFPDSFSPVPSTSINTNNAQTQTPATIPSSGTPIQTPQPAVPYQNGVPLEMTPAG